MKWQAIDESDLHLRQWEDEVVAYNALSGDTHLITPAAADLLAALLREPSDQASLAPRMATAWETQPDADLDAAIGQLLAELETLALVSRVPA